MFELSQKKNNVVVFSQWSRKGYAIFSGLKKVVRIARLSIDVCHASLLKTSAILHLLDLEINIEADENIKSVEIELEKLLILLLGLSVNSLLTEESQSKTT